MTALLETSKDPKAVLAEAEKALTMPIGAASPLWAMFAGAATAGVAFWWLTRWRSATNLEAVLVAAEPAPLPVEEPELLAVEIVEAVAVVTEPDAPAETLVEATIEAAPEPEPAVEPVLEAVAPAKPAKAKAARAAAAPDA